MRSVPGGVRAAGEGIGKQSAGTGGTTVVVTLRTDAGIWTG